ncbi:regulator of protease activity HflC (stomatin/prohibitin superfamily) [Silvibacterium bohemicum]|uniref:Regulator of protease activity HflC (Stomatin/prohibitin superfamily) n=1 Tax=Silvibacterium bohemicum TaxID=1577686 RepID=A0A841JPN8_9BACT|nr:SPFH domain-containing protein [Silvibacterium bohemicum]MBB6142537.1 regulator of protease activity HflC (stomatin/prohibitin superfamily) [Silvibacterium bohemicum]
MNANSSVAHQERVVSAIKGAPMVAATIILLFVALGLVFFGAQIEMPLLMLPAILIVLTDVVLLKGFFTLQPNEARVLLLFGSYKGTVRSDGFFWANPFYSNGTGQFGFQFNALQAKLSAGTEKRGLGRNKISLRARTLNGGTLKVNDLRGNPIEIAAVVIWRVADTAQAMFDVDNYENYVATQSESALRHLANLYAYDDANPEDTTLRRNVDEVSAALCKELTDRLSKAGVAVDEARLTHLAYASEIAQVMLRSSRQTP